MTSQDHPSREDLLALVYAETPSPGRDVMMQHLAACDACRRQFADWQSLRSDLQTWRLPAAAPTPRTLTFTWTRRAIAASLLLAAGFALARLTAPAATTPQQLQSQISSAVAAQLAPYAADQNRRQDALAQSMASALKDVDDRRLADTTALRRDVETVAVRTRDAFTQLVLQDRTNP